MSRPWDPFAPAPTEQATAGPPAAEPPGDDLDGLTKAQLIDRAFVIDPGLSTSGTKAEIIERLRER